MFNSNRSAQKNNTDTVFNHDKSKDCPRPTAKGEERIQKGAKFMPEYTIEEMEERMANLKEGKEKTVLLACIKRKEFKTIDKIAEELHRRPGTIRGWLVRGRERGLNDLDDHKPPGRAQLLSDAMIKTVQGWLSKSPEEFGYERKRWQSKMIKGMMYEKLGMGCSTDTVRRMMHSVDYSFRKSRPAPHKTATEEEQKEFKKTTAERLKAMAILGYVIMAMDEASCMVGGWNGYGWLPVGGHETIPMSWSKKSVRLMGVLGDGWFHIAIVDSTNSETLKSYIDKVREGMSNVAVVLDNASSHKSQTMNEYERDSNGGMVRIFLPKYTPQLNPIEVLWRDLKRALAGNYFDSIDDLKATITGIVNNGELAPPKLMDYMLPDGAQQPIKTSCRIWDMTSETSGSAVAA